jgi:hypothetical protein
MLPYCPINSEYTQLCLLTVALSESVLPAGGVLRVVRAGVILGGLQEGVEGGGGGGRQAIRVAFVALQVRKSKNSDKRNKWTQVLRIRNVCPGSRIRIFPSRVKKIHGSRIRICIKEFLYSPFLYFKLTQKIVSKHSEI